MSQGWTIAASSACCFYFHTKFSWPRSLRDSPTDALTPGGRGQNVVIVLAGQSSEGVSQCCREGGKLKVLDIRHRVGPPSLPVLHHFVWPSDAEFFRCRAESTAKLGGSLVCVARLDPTETRGGENDLSIWSKLGERGRG